MMERVIKFFQEKMERRENLIRLKEQMEVVKFFQEKMERREILIRLKEKRVHIQLTKVQENLKGLKDG